MARDSNTRARLLAAAKALFHQQGVHRTTIADVATAAEVPLGNVYYHFRTKDDLVAAVVDDHCADLRRWFAECEQAPDPRARLKAFIQDERADIPAIVRFGCPYGSLSSEIEKSEGLLAEHTATILRLQLDWFEHQFRALGRGEQARTDATDLLAALQGALLLSHTFRSPELMATKLDRIDAWLDTLSPA
jgi:TetR/AcrR family transcriptional regulator, transcriptional repressor for nem operon